MKFNEYSEIWISINGYDNIYQISNYGRVKSLSRYIYGKGGGKRLIAERMLTIGDNGLGYKKVILQENGANKMKYIHRLVADAFIENPQNKRTVNHKNGIKSDNRAENLEWNTQGENLKHAFMNGLRIAKKGENCIHSKLKNYQVIEIQKLINEKIKNIEIAKKYNVSTSTITRLKNLINEF